MSEKALSHVVHHPEGGNSQKIVLKEDGQSLEGKEKKEGKGKDEEVMGVLLGENLVDKLPENERDTARHRRGHESQEDPADDMGAVGADPTVEIGFDP